MSTLRDKRKEERRKKQIMRAVISLCISITAFAILLVILLPQGDKDVTEIQKGGLNTEAMAKESETSEALSEASEVEEVTETESEAEQAPVVSELSAVGTMKPTSVAHNNDWISTDVSAECIGWGQGSRVDALNRPEGSIVAQNQYGKYNAYFIKETEEKVIYLTMDEGYECGYTNTILDTLKEKQVPCVFFITEPYAKTEPELVQRMIDEGHELGNHTVNHPSAGVASLDLDSQYFEVQDNHNYVKENYGYEMHLFRFPAGIYSEQSLAVVNNCGYTSVFWSFAYYDYNPDDQPDQTEALQKIMDHIHPGAIYLLHAESSTNTAILGSFIDQARALGYTFALLD